jgi:lysophospholipase L1-like esterase
MIRRFLDKFSSKAEKSYFLALGDSIISDCFPGPGLGVASLLHKNREDRFPAWVGKDLQSLWPGIQRLGFTRTGVTLEELEAQLKVLPAQAGCRVGLLSVGGNDLMNLGRAPRSGDPWFDQFEQRYGAFWTTLQRRFPSSCWLACNVYDPSDGSGQLPGWAARGNPARPELLGSLELLNGIIARVSGAHQVDVHAACLGHGWSRQKPLWFQMDIEPTVEGASQIRSLLWQRVSRRSP